MNNTRPTTEHAVREIKMRVPRGVDPAAFASLPVVRSHDDPVPAGKVLSTEVSADGKWVTMRISTSEPRVPEST